eukprot:GFYU01007615.1.p1 GENE.GFYU01007615.1~~GFYU01007615.1.p1  ORF type:complete len:257 (-),score=24.64 GFYU01007615.1:34-804(-)
MFGHGAANARAASVDSLTQAFPQTKVKNIQKTVFEVPVGLACGNTLFKITLKPQYPQVPPDIRIKGQALSHAWMNGDTVVLPQYNPQEPLGQIMTRICDEFQTNPPVAGVAPARPTLAQQGSSYGSSYGSMQGSGVMTQGPYGAAPNASSAPSKKGGFFGMFNRGPSGPPMPVPQERPAPSAPPPSYDNAVKTDELEHKLEELEEQMTCKICMAEKINCAMVPCGHQSTCYECGTQVNKCPICRNAVKSLLKTYIA